MTQQCDYAAKIANTTWSSVNGSVVCGRGEIVQASCSSLMTIWSPKSLMLPATYQTFPVLPLQALCSATAILCCLAL